MFALFTGLAAAQVGGVGQNQQLTCNTNVSVTPALRGEGFTEQTGDIVISCTGGQAIPLGNAVPSVNITVFYNTLVTSRLLPTSSPQSSTQTSEALLLIDEPGSTTLSNYGPQAPQSLCTSPLTGCAAVVGYGPTLGGIPSPPVAVIPGTANGSNISTLSPNVYQGVVNGNGVTFFGVPALPPTTNGSRVYRITNVRVNAVPLSGGSASIGTPVQASISISNATSLTIQNSTPTVGYVFPSLTTSADASAYNQCDTKSKVALSLLTYKENFGTAFKTRVLATSNAAYAGQINNPVQNVPGDSYYNSESNFVFPINSTQVAGLANYGTRFKATFNNIPSGAHIYVSTSNVSGIGSALAAPASPGGNVANANNTAGYVGYARLVSGETVDDGNAGLSGFFVGVDPSTNSASGSVPIVEISIANGTGTAVWEAINTNSNTIESFKFGTYISYDANVAQNAPLPGDSTVNMSYAPVYPSGAASSSQPIPRFAGDSAAARRILTINICRTILLYPYVTNQAGFDTGLTIANTSQDPFTTGSAKTGAQAGSCTLTWYGGTTTAPTTPPGPSDTGSIAAGTVWVNTLQTIAPNFQGYMFAVCNFQYAHGFAFISDVGARNLAMGYLAVVIGDPGSSSRGAVPLGGSLSSSGEQGAH